MIGAFHVVQYWVNPIPPADNPALERREVTLGEPWTPVAANIENLQFQYSQGTELIFRDVPNPLPVANDPETWITGVRITITGRSASKNLERGYHWCLRRRGHPFEKNVHDVDRPPQPARKRGDLERAK